MWWRNHNRRSNHVDTVHECDRRTDRITMTKTVQRIASHGKNRDSISRCRPWCTKTSSARDQAAVPVCPDTLQNSEIKTWTRLMGRDSNSRWFCIRLQGEISGRCLSASMSSPLTPRFLLHAGWLACPRSADTGTNETSTSVCLPCTRKRCAQQL